MKTNAMVAFRTGGPEILESRELEIGSPGKGQVLIEHKAIGVNFIDTYFRGGVYPWPGEMPIIPGGEAAGDIVETGPETKLFQVGDRVAYTVPNGCYKKYNIVDADRLIAIPDGISHEIAAASMIKGLTAHYLLHRTFRISPEHTALYHAAAGGVGLFVGQWANHIGATIIGTVSTEEKMEIASANGYHHLINYKDGDFVEKVKEITNGNGVDVVYDSVGQATYPHSLKCLKRLGTWVCFGQSSGLIKDFNLGHLAQHGSLFATRPTLFHYIATRKELEKASNDLFGAIKSGILKVSIHQKYALSEAAKVHNLLEGRMTKGSTVLIP